MTPGDLARAFAVPGRVALPFTDPFSPDRPLVLHGYRPAGHRPDAPVVLVQHGMGRNGDEYRDAWVPAADAHGLLIAAVTFPDVSWPGARAYNDGHVREEDGAVRPREAWSQAIPGRVFAMLRDAGVTARERAHLWGHSAGAQFVHRLLATQPHDWLEAVGAGNAGWYTRPSPERPYPEGLGGIGLDDSDLARLLAYPLVVFAGDRDTDTAADNLPKHAAALAQGPHRFARAQNYVARGQAEAARRGLRCNWRLVLVPGIGHEGMRMSAVAARHWFGGPALPEPEAGREITAEA